MRAVTEIIDSVIGFNLKVEIVGQDGEPLKTGVKTTWPEEWATQMNVRQPDPRAFTNFNHALLEKIRNFRSLND
jgi:hypothetical protein